jgi:hypothetical protein
VLRLSVGASEAEGGFERPHYKIGVADFDGGSHPMKRTAAKLAWGDSQECRWAARVSDTVKQFEVTAPAPPLTRPIAKCQHVALHQGEPLLG